MNSQELLLKQIRKRLKSSNSIIEEVSAILNISYDAAHRRVSMKSKFSIEETVTICHHYGFSMDAVFSNQRKVMVEKTKEVNSFDDLVFYFEQSVNYLKYYEDKKNVKLFYSAKDIPLFHTIDGTLLSKFKLYVWINLLLGTENQEAFEKFNLPNSIQPYTETLRNIYKNVEVSEIWNDTTINSTLQQIIYFYDAGLMTFENTNLVLDDLKNLLRKLEEKSSANNKHFELYYNELLILNNNVLLNHKDKYTLFVPYTLLGYFITEDENTCTNAAIYYENQIKNSKSLNNSGIRDRKLFFNKINQKIVYFSEKITTDFSNEF